MARTGILLLLALTAVSGMRRKGKGGRRGGRKQEEAAIVTCPGFPGYCSESYVGNTCLVVCARGRNNVPQCQADGTWTDIPRCIEHDPGVEEQKTDYCPGVPGYCSLDLPGGLCTFECPLGPDIRYPPPHHPALPRSSCTPDGTWDPYPTCQDDPRETQDGCDPCPGPVGAFRNRTAEAAGGGAARKGATPNKIPDAPAPAKQAGGRAGPRKAAAQRPKSSQRKSGGGRQGGGGRKQGGGGGRKQGGGRGKQGGDGGDGGACPGEELQACIDVCPGFSARVFGACVAGCAKRCGK